jgi:hypothetical protein
MSLKINSAISVIGIDLGKNSFHVVGHDNRGAIILRQKWSRGQVEARLANLPPCLIGMEAFGTKRRDGQDVGPLRGVAQRRQRRLRAAGVAEAVGRPVARRPFVLCAGAAARLARTVRTPRPVLRSQR